MNQNFDGDGPGTLTLRRGDLVEVLDMNPTAQSQPDKNEKWVYFLFWSFLKSEVWISMNKMQKPICISNANFMIKCCLNESETKYVKCCLIHIHFHTSPDWYQRDTPQNTDTSFYTHIKVTSTKWSCLCSIYRLKCSIFVRIILIFTFSIHFRNKLRENSPEFTRTAMKFKFVLFFSHEILWCQFLDCLAAPHHSIFITHSTRNAMTIIKMWIVFVSWSSIWSLDSQKFAQI